MEGYLYEGTIRYTFRQVGLDQAYRVKRAIVEAAEQAAKDAGGEDFVLEDSRVSAHESNFAPRQS